MMKLELVVQHILAAISANDKDRLPYIVQCYTCPKTRPPICNENCRECWGEKVRGA